MGTLNGKKTYILVILGLVSAACLYAQAVLTNGFTMDGLLQFINSEAVLAGLGTLRLAISKKA